MHPGGGPVSAGRTGSGDAQIEFAMDCVKQAGGQNIGVNYLSGGALVWWTDGKTHSTLTMYAHQITSVFDGRTHTRIPRQIRGWPHGHR